MANSIISVVKMGRLSDGFQKDHGVVRHAMRDSDYSGFGSHSSALCGAKPGRRSVGFVNDPDITEITCPRCKKRVERLEERDHD